MLPVLLALKENGCDMSGALERTLGDEEFLLKCIKMAMNEPEFELLGNSINEKDLHLSFEYAHALKGVIGNVGLTTLYVCIVKIVETLRLEKFDNVENDYRELMSEKDKIQEIINNAK